MPRACSPLIEYVRSLPAGGGGSSGFSAAIYRDELCDCLEFRRKESVCPRGLMGLSRFSIIIEMANARQSVSDVFGFCGVITCASLVIFLA